MSMEGYPLLEGGTYPPEAFVSGGYGGGSEYTGVAPLEEFSTEDNQLLLSVLSSTPVAEQYNIAYPQSGPAAVPMWDSNGGYSPHMSGSFGYATSSGAQHVQHVMAANRSPPMVHHSMSSQMHQSHASSTSHLGAPTHVSPYGHAQAHNPFAIRHELSPHGATKNEGVVPMFTPNSSPYALPPPQTLANGFSPGMMPPVHTSMIAQRTYSYLFSLSLLRTVRFHRGLLDNAPHARPLANWEPRTERQALPRGDDLTFAALAPRNSNPCPLKEYRSANMRVPSTRTQSTWEAAGKQATIEGKPKIVGRFLFHPARKAAGVPSFSLHVSLHSEPYPAPVPCHPTHTRRLFPPRSPETKSSDDRRTRYLYCEEMECGEGPARAAAQQPSSEGLCPRRPPACCSGRNLPLLCHVCVPPASQCPILIPCAHYRHLSPSQPRMC